MLRTEPVLGLNPTVWPLSGSCCKYFLSDLTGFVHPITAPQSPKPLTPRQKANVQPTLYLQSWKNCSLQPWLQFQGLHTPIIPASPPACQGSDTPGILVEEWPEAPWQGWDWGEEVEGHLRQDCPREESRKEAVKTMQIQSESFCGR